MDYFLPMENSLELPFELDWLVPAILFSAVVVVHPLIFDLIPLVLLCVSGLVINLIQAICFVCIWPISKNSHTRINAVVKALDWLVLLGISDWCAGIKILNCLEQEASHLKGDEHKPDISNARNDGNPLLELVPAQWSGCFGSLLAVIKTLARYIQWSGCFGSLLAVIKTLARYIQQLKSDPLASLHPFWLSVVLERTGFAQGEILPLQRYPVPSKVLSPKHLVYAVRHVCSAVPVIYFLIVAIPETSPPPTLGSVIKGEPSVGYVLIEGHATKRRPETDDTVEKWCTKILADKDALLDEYIAKQTFGDKGLLGWPVKCPVVVISLIVLGVLLFNFVCHSTLLVLTAALFTGWVLAQLAAVFGISWSDEVMPIILSKSLHLFADWLLMP